MHTWIRAHGSTLSGGLLVATLLGFGGLKLYHQYGGDCCGFGAPCCHAGSPCCHHDAKAHPLAPR